MKNMHKPLRSLVSAAVIGVLTTTAAHAGGFSLYTEGSAYATGNFAAGIAAEAADASTGWYNPAGLSLLHEKQAVFGGVGVFPKAELTGTSTFAAAPVPYVQNFNGIDGGENAFVPSFHAALPVGANTTVGISMIAPFGLATDWGPQSSVRYQATFTELLTTNLSPEIGSRLSDNFAVGAGLDLQYARVKFNRMLGAPTIYGNVIPPFNAAGVDSLSYNKGNSVGVGYHVGAMGIFNDQHTRIGLNYQSHMRHKFNGYSRLTGPLANPASIFGPVTPPAVSISRSNDLTSNSVNLPDIVTLSGYHDVNEKLALLGSVVFTGWSSFKEIQLNNVAAPSIGLAGTTQVRVNSLSPQNYSDAWRAAIGANYRFNDAWMLRVGGGYDQTPTNDIDRDVRLPDADRWALSIGAHYQMRDTIGFDVGYTHLFGANDAIINRTDALSTTSSYNVNALGKARADLVGAQVVWTLDPPPVVATK
ncbi:MAG: outer membrane protein transport protein [Legionella sp.]|nr:outer membrane protein transport protein [Legionella sp.]